MKTAEAAATASVRAAVAGHGPRDPWPGMGLGRHADRVASETLDGTQTITRVAVGTRRVRVLADLAITLAAVPGVASVMFDGEGFTVVIDHRRTQ